MWTQETRARYDRSKLRYPSDVTDQEWATMAPLIPPAKPGGNKRSVDVRAVVHGVMYGVMYILSTGCQWAALPKDLPPRSTVNDYLRRWDEDRTLDSIHHAFTCCAANRLAARPVRRRRSSTAKASRAPKKGALHRPVGL